jgi:branched-chain amino acid transport system permease protein
MVPVAGLGVAAVLPLFVGESSVALENMVLAAAYVIMALGLNVVVGFAGLLDLGYVAFFAIGANVTASFASTFWGIHLSFLLVALLAMVATTGAGVLIGVPTLRVRGDYVGVITLAFGEIVAQVVANGQQIHIFGGSLTAGPVGVSAIDPIDLPFFRPFNPLDLRPWYWFALTLVALVLLVNVRLRNSRMGRAWIALRDDEEAAASAGVPIVRTKLQAYAVGAALGGLAGAFLASYLGTVNSDQFTFSFSILILAMVVLGGLGSVRGAVLGAIVLSALNNYLLPDVLYNLPGKLGLHLDLAQVSAGIYGFLLVAIVLLRPEGLLPARRQRSGAGPVFR